MNIIERLGLLFFIGIFFTACENGDNRPTITFAYASWEEDAAMSNVAKTVLENHGYNVKFRHADIQPIFKHLLPKGKVDAFLDVWMPTTHQKYMKDYGQELEVLGTNYEKAKTGLVVPEYVPVNSISELNEKKKKFKRKITGIDLGAGIMESTEKALTAYHLDFQLIPSTNFAMVTALRKAIDDQDWIVVTGWTPHSIFSRFDLKMLKDPKKVYGESEKIKTVARKGFSEDHPAVAEFLKNMNFTKEQMASLMMNMENAKHNFEGAETWIDQHEKVVKNWLPKKMNSSKNNTEK